MSDQTLLPPNQSHLEKAVSIASQFLPDLNFNTLWSPLDCDEKILPWLAWTFSVDEWDDQWAVDIQRKLILESIRFHKIKGTVLSVKKIFEMLGLRDVEIDEGRSNYSYDGLTHYDGFANHGAAEGWAYYRIRFQQLISQSQANSIQRMITETAPIRCKLWALDFTKATLSYNRFAQYDGAYTYGIYQ